MNTIRKEVSNTTLTHDAYTYNGLPRGIYKATKALDKGQAHLYVLVSDCDRCIYVQLVEALCAEHQINLIKVGNN